MLSETTKISRSLVCIDRMQRLKLRYIGSKSGQVSEIPSKASLSTSTSSARTTGLKVIYLGTKQCRLTRKENNEQHLEEDPRSRSYIRHRRSHLPYLGSTGRQPLPHRTECRQAE